MALYEKSKSKYLNSNCIALANVSYKFDVSGSYSAY